MRPSASRSTDPPMQQAQSASDSVVARLVDASKTYERGPSTVFAVRSVSIDIAAGDLIVLLGPSGSGKTTLLNLLGAIEPASAGQVIVRGRDLTSLDLRELTEFRRTEIGFVFQFFNLVPTLTALENVELIAELTGGDPTERSSAALASVGLANREDHFPAELSGGEQQRVAVARALVKQPRLLLADEPTGSLDLDSGKQILSLLRQAAEHGQTVVLVTHNSAIAQIADRVIELRDGEIAADRRHDAPLPPAEVAW